MEREEPQRPRREQRTQNVTLVERAVDLIHAMGLAVATPPEAREMLDLAPEPTAQHHNRT